MSLISKTGIVNGQTIQAEHVTRIIDALTESGSSAVIATGSFTGSFAGDGSQLTGLSVATSSYALNSNLLDGYDSSYFATTGSNTFNGTQIINGDVTITGTASIAVLHVTYESASVIYSSGSNQLGDATSDIQTLIGTVRVSGSLNVTGSANLPSITGSLLGTSSFAVSASVAQNAISASYAPNSDTASFASTASFITSSNVYGPYGANSIASASYAISASYVIGGINPFPYTGSAEITGSLGVTGSVNVTRLGIGAIGSTSIPLDVRAQGALTTDTVFRIRTSANSADLLTISGMGDLTFGSGSSVANGGTPGIAIGNNATANSQFGSYPVALGYRANSKGNSVAIGPNSTAGDNGLFTNVAIGYNANAAGSSGFGIGAIALGSNTNAGSGGGNYGISVGASISDGGGTSNIILGRFFNGVSFTAGAFAFGSGVSDASRASLDIGNSFSVYINQNTRALFLNQKSNLVFKNGQSLTSGTNFDANATNTITLSSGSAPTTNIIDSVQFYVADITPGTASAHFRNEPGHIVKLYTQPAVTSSQGIADVLTNLGLLTGSSTIITDTASFATTASYALTALSASYAPGGGLTFFTESESTSSPNGTVYVDSLTAAASTTNADVAIIPKGSGSLLTAIPDGTTTGGNKRGTYAIDLQMFRTNADQVASGSKSIVIGANSKASATQAIAIGTGATSTNSGVSLSSYGNVTGATATAAGIGSFAVNGGSATGNWSFAMARSVASGLCSFAFGGYFGQNTANGDYGSLAIGEGNTASGQSSVALGGSNSATGTQAASIGSSNTASGPQSAAIGQSNISSGTLCIALGGSNTSAGYGSVTIGTSNSTAYDYNIAVGHSNTLTSGPSGNNSNVYAFGIGNTVNASNAIAIGAYGLTNGVTSRQTFSGGRIAVNGDAQKSTFFYRGRTTDATLTTLATDGNNSINAGNCMQLANNSSIRFKGTISGKQSGSTNIAAWDIDGLIVRGASAAATTLTVGNVNLVSNIPAWGTPVLSAFIDAFNGIGALRIQIQGAVGTNIQWTAVIETTEVIYA